MIRGCVPKKLLVYGAAVGEHLADAPSYGWPVPPWRPKPMCCWSTCARRWIGSTTSTKRPSSGPGWRWCGAGVTSWTPGACRRETRHSGARPLELTSPTSVAKGGTP